jgi:hypothetical protein
MNQTQRFMRKRGYDLIGNLFNNRDFSRFQMGQFIHIQIDKYRSQLIGFTSANLIIHSVRWSDFIFYDIYPVISWTRICQT